MARRFGAIGETGEAARAILRLGYEAITSRAISENEKHRAADRNPAASRVRAADRVMEHAKNFLEFEDAEVRLRRLEQQVAERGGGESH